MQSDEKLGGNESEHSAIENGTGTDYASSMDDSSLTQVSTGW